MSKDCPDCSAFGKHCPHEVNGDPYFYDCYLTVAELEKENAELKDDNKVMADNYSKMEQKFYNNLTKAKEIIREFMKYEINEYDGSLEIHFEELKKQAEQFLNEVEK